MSKKSISFKKGKGSINHNNREFFTDNVDRERSKNNIYYIKQDIMEAYNELFSDSIKEYDSRQIRKDRRIGSAKEYMIRLKNSKNKEQLYYEVIVQIGDMHDSGVNTNDGKICYEVLNQYALTFQLRNPHLHVFNMVLHGDEKSFHLHLDLIPCGSGYSQGLRTRNSLSKALENQGFSNACRNKYNNSTLAWQKKERAYLKEICKEHGIETTELGLKRDDMELEVYKMYATLEESNKNLREVQVEVKELEDQSNYYEETLLDIDDINYTIFSIKQAEEDNKALQYENRKLKEEKEKLIVDNKELKKAAELWNLLMKGIHTYMAEKSDWLLRLIEKLISRGLDPLQAHIDDQKDYNIRSSDLSKSKFIKLSDEECYGREERS